MNRMGDFTAPEYAAIHNGARVSDEDDGRGGCDDHVATTDPLPTNWDWRTRNAVTPVKDQGECGSCWAFSAVGAAEAHKAIKDNQPAVALSEQNLIDCSRPQGNMACDGGYPNNAYKYIQKFGINTEAAYPYTAANTSACGFMPQAIGAKVEVCRNIPQNNEKALVEAIAILGPVSVCIDASHATFQFYKAGVYNDQKCSSTKVDHGVLAVGYGTEDNMDYYLIKNSFGTGWGEQGYIRLVRNENNRCGISTTASYPLTPEPPKPPPQTFSHVFPSYG